MIAALLQAPVPDSDPFNLIQWGVLGIVLAALLTGWLWPKPAVDNMREQANQARDRLAQFQHEVSQELREVRSALEQVKAAMYGYSATTEEAEAVFRDAIKRLDDLYARIDRDSRNRNQQSSRR